MIQAPPVRHLTQCFTPGIRYMLLAALWFIIMHSIIKAMTSFHVFEVIFFRSTGTALLCLALLRKESIPLAGNQPILLISRALLGVVSMTCFFTTLQRLPMGASVSLKYLAPIFAAIFATLFLKERVRPVQWFFFGVAFVGVLLLKGFDMRIDMLNLSLGILGALTGGLVYVTIRRIGKRDHPLVIVNYFMVSAAVLSGFAMIPVWTTPVGAQWLWLLAIGSMGFLGQLFHDKGLSDRENEPCCSSQIPRNPVFPCNRITLVRGVLYVPEPGWHHPGTFARGAEYSL